MAENVGHKFFDPKKCLPGEYELLGQLGQGAQGRVYKARLRTIDTTVAVKFIQQDLLQEEKKLRHFQKEAKAIAGLNHPNIVKVLQIGIGKDDTPFLIYEFLEGETLKSYLGRKKTLSVRSLVCLFQQLCSALSQAHSLGIVHRDLKPANIMLLPEQSNSSIFHVKLLDFGIAKIIKQNDSASAQSDTSSQRNAGTPAYMSPEQCNSISQDARSDVYSLACILYECLLGKVPFEGDSPTHTMYLQANQAPALPNPALTKSMNKLLHDCLAKDPKDRPASAEEFGKFLQSALKDLGRARNGSKRKILPFSLLAIITVSAVFATAVLNLEFSGNKHNANKFIHLQKPVSDQSELEAIGKILGESSTRSAAEEGVARADKLILKLGKRRKDLLLSAYGLKASALKRLGNNNEAVKSWSTAISICRDLKKKPVTLAAVCQVELAKLMLLENNPDKSIQYANQAIEEFKGAANANYADEIELRRDLGIWDWHVPVGDAFVAIARAELQKKDTNAAIKNTNLAIQEYTAHSNALALEAEVLLADILLSQNKKEQAFQQINEYQSKLLKRDTALEHPDYLSVMETLRELSIWYESNADFDSAIKVLKIGIKMGEEHNPDKRTYISSKAEELRQSCISMNERKKQSRSKGSNNENRR